MTEASVSACGTCQRLPLAHCVAYTPVACSLVLLDYFQNEFCWPLNPALLTRSQPSVGQADPLTTYLIKASPPLQGSWLPRPAERSPTEHKYRTPLTYTHPTTHCSCGGRGLIVGLSTSSCAHVRPRQELAIEPRRVSIAFLASNITLGDPR